MISWRFSSFLLGLSWVASACLPLATQAGTFKRITIDGSFTDWAGVPALVDDGVDSAANVVDYGKVYVANDDDYLYVRFTTSKIVNPFTSHENIFIDTDNDSSTGYQTHVGSELLIQGGTGYQEKIGVFNAGTIEGLDWKAMPADNAADFEIRISRRAKYSSDGLPVFVGDVIQLVLEAETASFAAGEFAPGIGGAQYEFAAAPPVAHGTTSLVTLTATEWLYDDSGSVPMTTWREVDFDGTAWKTGTGLFGYTSQPAAYPVPIKTALTKDRTAYYFRTVFPWTNDSRGLALVASNYVSDGAVFYLNGAAVSRLRLGTGTVTNGSTATGSAQPVGALSVLAIPPVALVEGTNVLAVEVHVDLGTPADLVFGLSLIASDQVAPQITDSTQPTNRTVIEGISTTFSVPFLGAEPLFFQWYKGSVAILDATNATFTLGPVTAEDAGNYQIKISNALASGITSRFAVLKTKALPAKIADATLPTDLTVVQGREARFTVTADGSPPFNYQWLKDGAPIVGATNATFILPAARVTDAGQYAVQVGNRLVDRANSRAATLIVQRDLTGPTITSVQGGPNEVIINFSEPVDPVTASAVSNYLVNPGVTIQKAIVEAITPQTVRLETLGQILGQAYHVTVSKVEDLFKNAISPASKVTFRSTILIDGSFDDWAGVPIAISDPADTMTGTDFKDVWVTNDEQYLYIRFTLHSPGDPSTFYNNIFIDVDADSSTGLSTSGLGSDFLIQSGSGYQEKTGEFNAGGVDGLDWAAAPAGQGIDFEMRISRTATYSSDGKPVFTGTNIVFTLETENSSFATVDTAPDTGGTPYTFKSFEKIIVDNFNLTLERVALGNLSIAHTGPIQSRGSLTQGSWEDVADAATPLIVNPSDTTRYYRAKP